MSLKESETVVQIPGNPNPTTRRTREWVCPDCDYFEDVEEEGRQGSGGPVSARRS